MAIVDTDLVSRWYIDEAASGTTPTTLTDSTGGQSLTIDYDAGTADLEWTETSGNRGLSFNDRGSDAHCVDANLQSGDHLHDAFDGVSQVTFEIVAQLTQGAAGTGRVAVFNSGVSNAEAGMCLKNSDATIFWGEVQVRSWTVNTSRNVYHIVFDTTLATANDRVKLYVNGTLDSSIDVDANPTQNDTLEVTSLDFFLGNRGVGSYGRSIDGIIYYVAVYDGAMSSTDISTNYNVLTSDDDTPVAGGGMSALFDRPPEAAIGRGIF